jgi:hypothetical protein
MLPKKAYNGKEEQNEMTPTVGLSGVISICATSPQLLPSAALLAILIDRNARQASTVYGEEG